MKKAEDCRTLSEYRLEVLREPQHATARRAERKQAWISQVERGHLPRPWHWAALLRGYRLEGQEDQFVRMILTAKKLAELQRSPEQVREEYPLFHQGQDGGGQSPAVLGQAAGAAKGA